MVDQERKVLIAPSILAADFSRLAEEVRAVERARADWLHIDVMDGNFVPNITIGPGVVGSIRPHTGLFFDVHLMIADPAKYADDFLKAGSEMLTFHVESVERPDVLIKRIKNAGAKAGLSLKPGTPVEEVHPFLELVDMVLVMTVEPGFGGQRFMEGMMDKVSSLRSRFSGYIQVDGGIGPATAPRAVKAGADVLVAGTAIFAEEDYGEAVRRLRAGRDL